MNETYLNSIPSWIIDLTVSNSKQTIFFILISCFHYFYPVYFPDCRYFVFQPDLVLAAAVVLAVPVYWTVAAPPAQSKGCHFVVPAWSSRSLSHPGFGLNSYILKRKMSCVVRKPVFSVSE